MWRNQKTCWIQTKPNQTGNQYSLRWGSLCNYILSGHQFRNDFRCFSSLLWSLFTESSVSTCAPFGDGCKFETKKNLDINHWKEVPFADLPLVEFASETSFPIFSHPADSTYRPAWWIRRVAKTPNWNGPRRGSLLHPVADFMNASFQGWIYDCGCSGPYICRGPRVYKSQMLQPLSFSKSDILTIHLLILRIDPHI